MRQGSPPRMKIAGLFSAESPMSLALTTTHENGIFRGVSPRLVNIVGVIRSWRRSCRQGRAPPGETVHGHRAPARHSAGPARRLTRAMSKETRAAEGRTPAWLRWGCGRPSHSSALRGPRTPGVLLSLYAVCRDTMGLSPGASVATRTMPACGCRRRGREHEPSEEATNLEGAPWQTSPRFPLHIWGSNRILSGRPFPPTLSITCSPVTGLLECDTYTTFQKHSSERGSHGPHTGGCPTPVGLHGSDPTAL